MRFPTITRGAMSAPGIHCSARTRTPLRLARVSGAPRTGRPSVSAYTTTGILRTPHAARCVVMLFAVSAALLAGAGTRYDMDYAGYPLVSVGPDLGRDVDPRETPDLRVGTGRAVGKGVVYLVRLTHGAAVGLHATRGGLATVLVPAGAPDPTPGVTRALKVFGESFAVTTAPGGDYDFVFAAGESEPDALYRYLAGALSTVIPPGAILPSSGGRAVTAWGEPHFAGGHGVVVARDGSGGGSFAGIYRLADGRWTRVADTSNPLPEPVLVPDAFADRVGFDGTNVVFQASRGSIQALYHEDGAGNVSVVLPVGTPLPGGGTVAAFVSEPVLRDGTVTVVVRDAAGSRQLIRVTDGGVSVMARDGDLSPEGRVLTDIGGRGLAVDGSRVLFAATASEGPGIYGVEEGRWQTVVDRGLFPIRRDSVQSFGEVGLLDVRGSTMVLVGSPRLSSGSSVLVATLPEPDVPILKTLPSPVSVPLGGRIELTATASGEGPLDYRWYGPGGLHGAGTNGTMTIDAATAFHVGDYVVVVTNRWGLDSVRLDSWVNVQSPPIVIRQPEGGTFELGMRMSLAPKIVGGVPYSTTWYQDGVALPPSRWGHVLQRLPLMLADAGTYQCVISNAWGAVTSAPVTLTLRLPPPDPAYAGRRFVPLYDVAAQPAPGIPGEELPDRVLDARGSRWWQGTFAGPGERTGGYGAQVPPLVRTMLPGGGTARLWPMASAPNGLGPIQRARVIPATGTEGSLLVFAGAGRYEGIYRVAVGGVEAWVDLATPVPGTVNERFSGFPGVAAQAGERVAFVGRTATRTGVYLFEAGRVERLLDSTQALPGFAAGTGGMTWVGYDGETVAVLVTNLQRSAVFALGPDRGAAMRVQSGDPIPGVPGRTVSGIDRVAVDAGTVYLRVEDDRGGSWILASTGEGVSVVAGPGIDVPGFGKLEAIASAEWVAKGGWVFFTAEAMETSNLVSRYAVVAVKGNEARLVLRGGSLGDGVRPPIILDTDGDRVAVAVGREDSLGAFWSVYVNMGPGFRDAPPTRLEPDGSGRWRLPVPEGILVETAESPAGPWIYQPAGAFVPVVPEGDRPARFFRYRSE